MKRPNPRYSGAMTGCGVGIDALPSPIIAPAMNPPLITISGFTPKNAGAHSTFDIQGTRPDGSQELDRLERLVLEVQVAPLDLRRARLGRFVRCRSASMNCNRGHRRGVSQAMDREALLERARGRGVNPIAYWLVRGILQPFFHLYFRVSRIGRSRLTSS